MGGGPNDERRTGRPRRHDEFLEPGEVFPAPQRHILVPDTLLAGAAELLQRLDDFFHHYAAPNVADDLRAYAQALGWHPIAGPGAFLDSIAFTASSLTRSLSNQPGDENHHDLTPATVDTERPAPHRSTRRGGCGGSNWSHLTVITDRQVLTDGTER